MEARLGNNQVGPLIIIIGENLFYHLSAELVLQRTRIEYRHVSIHDGKGEQVAVCSSDIASQRADTVGVGERAGLGYYLTASRWSWHLSAQCAVDP